MKVATVITLVLTCISTFLLVINITMNVMADASQQEITPDLYQMLYQESLIDPGLLQRVKASLSDGKVTFGELDRLMAPSKEKIKASLTRG